MNCQPSTVQLSTSYTYDNNGNLILTTKNQQLTTSFSYDNNNQLVKVINVGGDTVEFIYDADGKRTQKTVTASGSAAVSTYYQYDAGGNIVLETDEDQNVKVKYVRNSIGKALAMEQGGARYYFLYNALGDVVSVADNAGNIKASYVYDEYGNLDEQRSTNYELLYNPLRFSGGNNAYYDTESGFYKIGARYYNPAIGRWTTRDTYEGEQESSLSQNLYAYCSNNPISKVDSNGHWDKAHHYNYTKAWAIDGNFKKSHAKSIAQHNVNFDEYKMHYSNDFSGTWSSSSHISRRFKSYYDYAVKHKNIRNFGYAMHCLQDQYAYMHRTHKRRKNGVLKPWNHSYTRPNGSNNNNPDDREKHHPYKSSLKFNTCLKCETLKRRAKKTNIFNSEWDYNMHVSHTHKSWLTTRWSLTRGKSKSYIKSYKKKYYE